MTEPENGASVRITLRDVYDLVNSLGQALAKATGAIEAHVQQPSHTGTLTELHDHESRIRKLEKVAWMALGIGAFAGIAVTVILYTLSNGGG